MIFKIQEIWRSLFCTLNFLFIQQKVKGNQTLLIYQKRFSSLDIIRSNRLTFNICHIEKKNSWFSITRAKIIPVNITTMKIIKSRDEINPI